MEKNKKNLSKMDKEKVNRVISFYNEDKLYEFDLNSLKLDELDVASIKNFLNTINSDRAYWSTLKNEVSFKLKNTKNAFENWYSEKYLEVDEANQKKTETWKKNVIFLDNADEFKAFKSKIAGLEYVLDQLNTIIASFDNTIWTLREIAKLTYAEMVNLLPEGNSLENF